MRGPKTRSTSVRLTENEFAEINNISSLLGVSVSNLFMEALYAYAAQKHEHALSFVNAIESGSIHSDDPEMLEMFRKKMEQMKNTWEELAIQSYSDTNEEIRSYGPDKG